jgi:hypothetical protein
MDDPSPSPSPTFISSPYVRSLIVSVMNPPSQIHHPLTHIPTNPTTGRRHRRHNRRPHPLPPRHAQNPAPIRRRILRQRRLVRSLQGHRIGNRRLSAERSSLFRHLRIDQIRAQPRRWYRDGGGGGGPHGCRVARGDCSVRGEGPYGSGETAGAGVPVSEFSEGVAKHL